MNMFMMEFGKIQHPWFHVAHESGWFHITLARQVSGPAAGHTSIKINRVAFRNSLEFLHVRTLPQQARFRVLHNKVALDGPQTQA